MTDTDVTAPERPGTERFGRARFGAPPPALPEPAPEPEPSRRSRRRRAVPALGLLALVLTALFGGWWWGSSGQVSVWQLRHDVAAGAALRPGDLVAVRVSSAAGRLAVRSTTSVVGNISSRSLPTGQLLPSGLLAQGTPLPRNGDVLIGIGAAPGNAPDGLRAGDLVTVLGLPDSARAGGKQAPAFAVLGQVEVYSVTTTANGQVLTLVVPADRAGLIAGLNAQQRIAVVQQP